MVLQTSFTHSRRDWLEVRPCCWVDCVGIVSDGAGRDGVGWTVVLGIRTVGVIGSGRGRGGPGGLTLPRIAAAIAASA
ncbi:MAG: hypothetical protein B7Z40_01510 [Bosea sp. 12-68-7]|nr:MAG: hypothetical protein B7Z40_01510 [Bosea sp. 12-68-7]